MNRKVVSLGVCWGEAYRLKHELPRRYGIGLCTLQGCHAVFRSSSVATSKQFMGIGSEA
jgi:hypothetical protein